VNSPTSVIICVERLTRNTFLTPRLLPGQYKIIEHHRARIGKCHSEPSSCSTSSCIVLKWHHSTNGSIGINFVFCDSVSGKVVWTWNCVWKVGSGSMPLKYQSCFVRVRIDGCLMANHIKDFNANSKTSLLRTPMGQTNAVLNWGVLITEVKLKWQSIWDWCFVCFIWRCPPGRGVR
jgi:hypothetical protein